MALRFGCVTVEQNDFGEDLSSAQKEQHLESPPPSVRGEGVRGGHRQERLGESGEVNSSVLWKILQDMGVDALARALSRHLGSWTPTFSGPMPPPICTPDTDVMSPFQAAFT